MRFTTYIPNDLLKPYVKTLAISKSEEENTYKVLPDTRLVIGFQYKGRLLHIENDKQIKLNTSEAQQHFSNSRCMSFSGKACRSIIYAALRIADP